MASTIVLAMYRGEAPDFFKKVVLNLIYSVLQKVRGSDVKQDSCLKTKTKTVTPKTKTKTKTVTLKTKTVTLKTKTKTKTVTLKTKTKTKTVKKIDSIKCIAFFTP